MRAAIISAFFCIICARISFAQQPPTLPRYESKYYVIYTDLDREAEQEAAVHVTKMFEVYTDRTRGFAGSIRGRLPFVLFKNEDDYFDAGGVKGSTGVFTGKALMAVAGPKLNARTWHVVQHEGFHQFASAVIGGDVPPWADEGLAEYFGEGLFTGDDLFTGVIPEWRRKRVAERMRGNGFEPVDRFMQKTIEDWNLELSPINYDQAWSMVHFLLHGENGKYQPQFVSFMNAISHQKGRTEAWNRAFGDTRGFEDRWREYWLNLPENPTDDVYRKATLSTITSFVARAFAAGQDFESMKDFAKTASEGKLKMSPNDFLPIHLLASAMDDLGKRLDAGEVFKIEHASDKKHQPRVILTTKSGAKFVAEFALKDKRVASVTIKQTSAANAR